ncbi:MAG: HlyD family efflux transporter periplasmic adaptor subunit, partial [Saprospiraceae bacterium]
MRITFFPFLSLLLACNAHQPETPVDAGAENVRAVVQSVQPQRRDLTDWLDLNAVTQYRRKENIRATATGYLRQFRLQPGDHLQAGATIGVLVTKEQAALHDLRDLPELQGTREPLPIKTEASGIVTALNFQEGDFVSEGEVIVTVSQPHSLALLLNVPYEYQRFVSPGQSCIITLPDGWELRGRVSKAMPSVDLASQTQLFLVELVGRHDLPENLNVGLRIARGKHAHVLCVPLTAVQT